MEKIIEKYKTYLKNLKENRKRDTDALTESEMRLCDQQIQMVAEIIFDLKQIEIMVNKRVTTTFSFEDR